MIHDELLRMPREEVRARLAQCVKIFPKRRIANMMRMTRLDLDNFLNGVPHRKLQGMGPRRLKKLASICRRIETGEFEWNGEPYGKSRVKINPGPKKAPPPVHRIMFQQGAPSISKGSAPSVQTMPSFKDLFGQKGSLLPFVKK